MFSDKIKILIFLPLLLLGCAHSIEVVKETREELPHLEEPAIYNVAQVLEDLKNLVQDATFYLNPACSAKTLVLSRIQKEMEKKFNDHFFSPWHQSNASVSKSQATWGIRTYGRNLGFGENKQPHTSAWLTELIKVANLEMYPNTHQKAITVRNTNLRILPTHKPHFNNFELAGEGYPFDNLQQSALWANTPLFISHLSSDRAWVFAESALAPGWLPMEDIAFVDDSFISQWETGYYVALTKDKVAISDDKNIFRFTTHIGAIFPKMGEDYQNYTILIAIANENRQAVIRTATLSKQVASAKPLELLPRNIAQIINQMLTQPYGWGGLYENRDCSSTTRDLFTPFGLWLPRNSSVQAKTGNFIALQNLNSQDKEQLIIQKGVPYLTLLWLEGHIMLYLGTYHGKAIAFHNMWGIKTRDYQGETGRNVVGRAVITTLQPGKELPEFDPNKGDKLKNILGMTILVPAAKLQSCY